jgi:hypothetical protein
VSAKSDYIVLYLRVFEFYIKWIERVYEKGDIVLEYSVFGYSQHLPFSLMIALHSFDLRENRRGCEGADDQCYGSLTVPFIATAHFWILREFGRAERG